MRWANGRDDYQAAAPRRGRSRRSTARARQQSAAAGVLVGALVLVGLVLVAPPAGSSSRLLSAAVLATLAGVLVGFVVDRWNQARVLDLRHHDLSVERGVPASTEDRPSASATVPTGSAGGQHRLFGECTCPSCAAGLPVTVDVRPETTRRAAPRTVVDLRAQTARPRVGKLGQR